MDDTGPAIPDSGKSQRAYEWIRAQMASQLYGPGSRLVMATIADSIGVSVVPVREAIRRLEAEGLVTFQRNVGAQVTLIDEDDYVFTMQALAVLEGAVTALAAPLLTPADLDHAESINEQMAALLEDFDPLTFTRLNQQFHAALFESCPNPRLLDLVRLDWSRLAGLRHSTFVYIPERARDSVIEHTEILDLIRTDADSLKIELATRHHRWRTVDAFLAVRHPTPSQPSLQRKDTA